MDNALYHVLHEGRRIGPYDRRTIVGMRMKKTLTSKQVLEGADGAQLTVAQLVHKLPPGLGEEAAIEPLDDVGRSGLAALASLREEQSAGALRGGSHSVVQGTFSATLLEVEGPGLDVPAFKGELEVRLQTKVLRLAGRVRDGLGWKDERIKLALKDIAHARLRGAVLDLWVRSASNDTMQRLALQFNAPESAGELAEGLPNAAPWPGSEPLARPLKRSGALPALTWAAAVGAVLAVIGVVAWVLVKS